MKKKNDGKCANVMLGVGCWVLGAVKQLFS
jgi:hypothetical protein